MPPVPSPIPSPAVGLTTPAVVALPEGQNVLCVEAQSNPHCDRYVADLARRLPVQANRREKAERQRERIDAMMPPGREGPCEYDESSETCSVEVQPPTAGQVRRVLAKAGYPAAVIRTARPADPAPLGSLLLAVPAGTACVFLFHDGDDSQSWTAGQLPDGTCLAS